MSPKLRAEQIQDYSIKDLQIAINAAILQSKIANQDTDPTGWITKGTVNVVATAPTWDGTQAGRIYYVTSTEELLLGIATDPFYTAIGGQGLNGWDGSITVRSGAAATNWDGTHGTMYAVSAGVTFPTDSSNLFVYLNGALQQHDPANGSAADYRCENDHTIEFTGTPLTAVDKVTMVVYQNAALSNYATKAWTQSQITAGTTPFDGGTIHSSITPSATTVNLGDTNHKFGNVWAQAGHFDASTIYLGDTAQVKVNAGKLQFTTDGSAWTDLPAAAELTGFTATTIAGALNELKLGGIAAATTTALGTVKIGANVGVAGDGTISVTFPDAYSLPTASATVLGGVKVDGSSITIASGVISSNIPAGQASGSATVGFVGYNGATQSAGQFDGGTTLPSHTTRLNYDGNFWANAASFQSDVTVAGSILPAVTNTSNLGDATHTFQKAYLTDGIYFRPVGGSDEAKIYRNLTGGATEMHFQIAADADDRIIFENGTSALLTVTGDGNVTIPGNLTVSGTTTTVNSTTVNVADATFQINNGGVDAGGSYDMYRPSGTVKLQWNNVTYRWQVVHGATGATTSNIVIPSDLAWANIANIPATFTPPTASATVLGGVKVGTNVAIDGNGVISVAAPYSLPMASATVLGGVKVGTNVAIDGNGVISVAAPYSLPTASATVLGGVKVDGSSITIASGVISSNIPAGQAAGSATVGFVSYNGTTQLTGAFDGGATAPVHTTRLNYDGNLYATSFVGPLTGNVAGNASTATLVGSYLSNGLFEVDTSGWSLYNDGAAAIPVDGTGGSPNETFAVNSTAPLFGTQDAKLTKDAANRRGQGVACAFSLPLGVLGQSLCITFTYKTGGSYADNDLGVYVYDVTNATLIYPSMVNLTANTSATFYSAMFSPSASTSYRLIFHTQSTNASAWAFEVDNVSIAAQQTIVAPAVSGWTAYPSTFTGFGTVTGVTALWRRVGTDMELHIKGICGTATGVQAIVTIPAGFTTAINTYPGIIQLDNSGASVRKMALVYAVGSNLTFGSAEYTISNNPGSFNLLGTDLFNGANNSFSIRISFTVSQWTSNINLITDFTEYVSYFDPTGTQIAANSTYNTVANMVYGSKGSTIPQVAVTSTTATTNTLYQINWLRPLQATDAVFLEYSFDGGLSWQNSAYLSETGIAKGAFQNGVYIGVLLGFAPTYATVYFSNAGRITGATWGAAGAGNWNVGGSPNFWRFRIRKVSNGNFAEVSPTIRCEYSNASATTGTAAIKYTTLVEDSQGMYNTSTGIFTAPIQGVYLFAWTCVPTASDNSYININGSDIQLIGLAAGSRNSTSTKTVRLNAGGHVYVHVATGAPADTPSRFEAIRIG